MWPICGQKFLICEINDYYEELWHAATCQRTVVERDQAAGDHYPRGTGARAAPDTAAARERRFPARVSANVMPPELERTAPI